MLRIILFVYARLHRLFGLTHDSPGNRYSATNIIDILIGHCTRILCLLVVLVSHCCSFSSSVLIISNHIATTFLSSRHNGLTTIYNISRHDDQLIRAGDLPYGILPPGSYCQCPGQVFLQHEPRDVTIFRIDERAKVHCFQLRSMTTDDPEFSGSIVVEESDAIKELGKRAESVETDLGRYGDQDKALKDLFPAYDCKHDFA